MAISILLGGRSYSSHLEDSGGQGYIFFFFFCFQLQAEARPRASLRWLCAEDPLPQLPHFASRAHKKTLQIRDVLVGTPHMLTIFHVSEFESYFCILCTSLPAPLPAPAPSLCITRSLSASRIPVLLGPFSRSTGNIRWLSFFYLKTFPSGRATAFQPITLSLLPALLFLCM